MTKQNLFHYNVNHEYHLACDNGKTSPLLKPFIPAYNVNNLGNNNYTCISNIKNKLLQKPVIVLLHTIMLYDAI
jgi:hypothetical protein